MLDEGVTGVASVVEILDRRKLVCELATQSGQASFLLQRTLEEARQDDGLKLAWQLEGNVAKLVCNLHGNYVVQAVIKQFPLARVGFIVEEMVRIGQRVAQNKIGCRSVLRLVEGYSADERVAALASYVLADFRQNVRHPYAHYVLEALLEHGQAAQKQDLVDRLKADFHWLSRDDSASHVVEKALRCSSVGNQDRRDLISIARKESLVKLANHRCGNKIVCALKDMPECRDQIKRWLDTPRTMNALQKNKFGRRLYSAADLNSAAQRSHS